MRQGARIVYNAGNRAPAVEATADRLAGALPLTVQLSSAGTVDYDGDALTYAWVVTTPSDGAPMRYNTPDPTLLLEEAGAYDVTLTVTDKAGAKGTDALAIVAGNAPPQVLLKVTEGNGSFYFPGEALAYRALVSDEEDGRLGAGIAPDSVSVTWEYVPSGLLPAELPLVADLPPTASARHLRAIGILEGSDCLVCHQVDEASAGPAYREVARRYQGDEGAVEVLAQKILQGGSGVWGDAPMPAHPAMTPSDARILVEYALSLADAEAAPQQVSSEGRLTVEESSNDERGAYVLRAAYTDAGAQGVAPVSASDAVLLRFPYVMPQQADAASGARFTDSRDPGFFIEEDGAYVGLYDIDLAGIDSVVVHVMTRFYTWSHFVGGSVELRLDAPDGELVGDPIGSYRPGTEGRGGSGEGGDNAPGRPVFFGSDPVGFDVSQLSGRRDLYIVFRNDQANGAPLFLLNGIAFEQGS
jgi:cytochrome c